jgi:hypothetical protein
MRRTACAEGLLAGGCYIAATLVAFLYMEYTDRSLVIRLNANDTNSDPRIVSQADTDKEIVAAVFERQRIRDRTGCRTKRVSADRVPALGRTGVVLGNRCLDCYCIGLEGLCV